MGRVIHICIRGHVIAQVGRRVNRQCVACHAELQRRYVERDPDRAREIQRAWYARNAEVQRDRTRFYRMKRSPEKVAEQLARARIKDRLRWPQRAYGISHDEFLEMLAAQNGKCAICRTALELAQRRKLHIDHDHRTGKVRAILCLRCNHVLGRLDDSIGLLFQMISYLQAHAEVAEVS